MYLNSHHTTKPQQGIVWQELKHVWLRQVVGFKQKSPHCYVKLLCLNTRSVAFLSGRYPSCHLPGHSSHTAQYTTKVQTIQVVPALCQSIISKKIPLSSFILSIPCYFCISIIGTNTSNFDGEIAAVLMAAKELKNYHPAATATKLPVFIIDSQTYITAIADNTPTDCPNLFHCREAIVLLLLNNWSVILQ